MRTLSPRGVVAVLVTAAVLVATPVVTASAASRPAQVGLVSYVGASLTSSGATLTVDWADVKGATKYEVFASTSYDALPTKTTPSVTVTGSRATVTKLAKGKDYFVQVRAVSSAGAGPRSWRVGHRTIAGEASSTGRTYSALTWNVCSNVCDSWSSRTKVINARITELGPDIVAMQEASRYVTPTSGYRFAFDGQNDILVKSSAFSTVKSTSKGAASGSANFAKKYANPGKGISWAAVKHSSGQYVVVVNVHLLVGTSGAALKQRVYEASRVGPYIEARLAKLAKSHPTLTDWSKAPVLLMGDVNSQKAREGDATLSTLQAAGWRDSFDQARALSRQHYGSANPDWLTKPIIGITWGSQIDKVMVRASRSIVHSWAHAGKMSGSSFVTPLGSDHHPVLVKVSLR